ncbi:MAG: VanW family protein [Fimbriimonadaceae bacterium]
MRVAEGASEPDKPRRSPVARAGIAVLTVLLVVTTLVAAALVAYPRRIADDVTVSGVDIGLLSVPAAESKLAQWWSMRETRPIELVGPSADAKPVLVTPRELGIQLDINATLGLVPYDDLRSWFERSVKRETPKGSEFRMVYDYSKLDVKRLQAVVAATSPMLAPAKATLGEDGKIVLTPEVSTMTLVLDGTKESLTDAISGGTPGKVLAVYGEKAVSDEELAKITDVVSTFSTNFSSGDRSRAQNLRIAAEKFDGVVLLPGERFSFNEFVGERSAANGFLEAGVYFQGRHEIDFGGGVCQVSTTLCNAVLFADLKVEKRGNHTFLVPYVPIGRDAAVAYGWLDFVFVNTHETPISIDADWKPGKLTFSVLGVKEEGKEVKLVPVVTSTWEHPMTVIEDPTLKLGQEKIIEKGGKGYRATTTKVVYKDGKEVSRELLFKSYYKGAPMIIQRGTLKDPEKPRDPFLPPIAIGS